LHANAQEYLKQEGVFGNLVIGDYNLDIVPIDYDLLSLEQPFAYRDCALNGDETVLYYAYGNGFRFANCALLANDRMSSWPQ
jgi:hypothetical protein